MKFEMLSRFIEEKQKKEEEHQQLVLRERSALEEVHALKMKYESVLRDSLKERSDKSKELDQLGEKIEKAEKTHKRRMEERQLYSHVVKAEITSNDVLVSWNSEYRPAFKEQKIDPVLERLMNIKSELAEAFLQYHDLLREYNAEKNFTANEIGDSYRYQLLGVEFDYRSEMEKFLITLNTLHDLESKQIPRDVIAALRHKLDKNVPITEAEHRLAERGLRTSIAGDEIATFSRVIEAFNKQKGGKK